MPDESEHHHHGEHLGHAAWSKLAQASNDVNHPMRLATLANVDLNGGANARLMVIRGADRALGRVWFHSDRRSAKIRQVEKHPHVCIVTYDPGDRVSIRLYGTVTLHERDSIADDHWQQILLSTRHAYGLPKAPTQALPGADPRLQQLWRHQRSKKIAEDRAHFVVIEVNVDRLEWIQIVGDGARCSVCYPRDDWAASECPECQCG